MKRKKLSWTVRLRCWLDEKVSDGSMGMIKLLTICTVMATVLFAVALYVISLVSGEEQSFTSAWWNTLASVINKWLPFYGDGWVGYRVIMTFAAIFGLFVASLLIGIITTAVEEKVDELKKGNIPVLEEGHIVVLGFQPGEYALIQELIYGADKRPCCIVVASEMDREEMEDSIHSNVECPKNVRIFCRSVNIFDPSTLKPCSLDTCRTVIISPTDNDHTIRALLAVTRILHEVPGCGIRTIAVLSENDYRIPPAVVERYGILLLHTEGTIARIMAHSCTQPGLSQTMLEMFHFDGSEMHIISLPEASGLTFEELLCRVDHAFPIGICKGEEFFLNPEGDMVLEAGDRLLVFCEESDSAKFLPARTLQPLEPVSYEEGDSDVGQLVIIGSNEFLSTVLYELPENVTSVTLADVKAHHRQAAVDAAAKREPKLSLTFFEQDISELSTLEQLVASAQHIVVLSDHSKEEGEADMQTIFTIMTLRDIRDRLGTNYNITAEMRRENNQNLLIPDNSTEFVVSSNMSSLFLAQLSESPELIKVFNELLTNEGNEVYLKTAKELHCTGTKTVLELRRRLLALRYVMIGWMDARTMKSTFDLSLDDSITLNPDDMLIIIGEN